MGMLEVGEPSMRKVCISCLLLSVLSNFRRGPNLPFDELLFHSARVCGVLFDT